MAARERLRLISKRMKKLKSGLHADGDGLMIQVTDNGSRSWILRTVVHGKRRDIGLGGWPTISLGEAREEAFRLRKIARAGGDPFAARAKGNVPVFSVAARAAHGERSGSWKNKKHAAQWIDTLEQYVFPTLGNSRVDGIRSEHIVRVLSPIWLKKPETAKRVLQRTGAVLLWAKGNGHRADSPRDEVAAARQALPRQNAVKKHHKALPYAEVPKFIARLCACGASEQIKLAFEFLILTAARTNEVLGAQWPEIDLKGKVWTIPGTRMKAKREHRVPLSDRCIDILNAARKLNDELKGHVFPGTVSGKPLSDMVFLMALRRMKKDITAHGFRSSFRDWCAEQTNHPREVAEAALAHVVKDATEAVYMRSTFFERRRELMTEWSNYATNK